MHLLVLHACCMTSSSAHVPAKHRWGAAGPLQGPDVHAVQVLAEDQHRLIFASAVRPHSPLLHAQCPLQSQATCLQVTNPELLDGTAQATANLPATFSEAAEVRTRTLHVPVFELLLLSSRACLCLPLQRPMSSGWRACEGVALVQMAASYFNWEQQCACAHALQFTRTKQQQLARQRYVLAYQLQVRACAHVFRCARVFVHPYMTRFLSCVGSRRVCARTTQPSTPSQSCPASQRSYRPTPRPAGEPPTASWLSC